MQDKEVKILGNVFISTGDNKLRLCDIYFGEKIKKIIPKTGGLFDWPEIEDKSEIEVLSRRFPLTESADNNVIDGKFFLAIPGAVDPHVHFNTPGFESRDTFQDASLAAAYGGVTTVIDMPCTSMPPVTNLENLKTKLDYIKDKSHVDFALWGGVPGNGFDEKTVERNITELAEAGVAGYKAYLISGMETFSDLNEAQMKLAAGLIAKVDKPLAVHAEDKGIINSVYAGYNNNDLRMWESYCGARNIAAESAAVLTMTGIAREIPSCRIHIVHLSSAAGLGIIKEARRAALRISAETCPHYLYFTQESFNDPSIRNYLKTAPPVKYEADKNALWDGLADGSISFITTDHAGCNPDEEKSSADFSKVYGGIPGVEHRVPFLFSEGFLKKKINLENTISLLSTNAADYFGLKQKGRLKENYYSDIALINLWSSELVASSSMRSKGKYTPFEGVRFNAVVEKTFLRGVLIADKRLSSIHADHNKQFLGRFINV